MAMTIEIMQVATWLPLLSRPSDHSQLPLNDFICPTWANVNDAAAA